MDMDTDSPDRSTARGLILPWGWLSLGLTIVTISSLGTLAVIAKREGADTLSTIALALAVLSFAAQLIVSLAQAFNGTQQVAQADRVNADTRASLAAIRATSEALLANQREQFGQVLHAALKVAVPAAVQDVEHVGESDESDGSRVHIADDSIKILEDRLGVRINEAVRGITTAGREPSAIAPRVEGRSAIRLKTYPSDEREPELRTILNTFSPLESAEFTKFASRTLRAAESRASENIPAFLVHGSGEPSPELAKAIDLNLVKVIGRSTARDVVTVRLTDLGVEMAGLILGFKRA